MINRQIIRNKIVQLTYAYYQNGNKNIDAAEKELFFSLSKAYDLYAPLPKKYARGREAHDALYDAMRSSWYTWQALKWLRQLIPYPFSS